jgi:hypothetical protein
MSEQVIQASDRAVRALDELAAAFATLKAAQLSTTIATTDGEQHHGQVHDVGAGMVVLDPFGDDADEVHIMLTQVVWFRASRR